MSNADRQRKYREKQKKIKLANDKKRKADRVDKDDDRWTLAEFYLFRADGDDFDGIDKNYCSLAPDGFRSVGPGHGPFHEPDRVRGLKMFARCL